MTIPPECTTDVLVRTGHLDRPVKPPFVEIFRDAILDMFLGWMLVMMRLRIMKAKRVITLNGTHAEETEGKPLYFWLLLRSHTGSIFSYADTCWYCAFGGKKFMMTLFTVLMHLTISRSHQRWLLKDDLQECISWSSNGCATVGQRWLLSYATCCFHAYRIGVMLPLSQQVLTITC